MNTSRRVLVSLESRATYGYSRNVMKAMENFPELELTTLVTGMHLMPEMGNSIELIKADGFPITAEVPLSPSTQGRGAWSKAMGGAISGYADALESINPDVVLLSGDRAETLSLCVAAAYMGLPIAHIQAGDKSGHIDDAARYAIAKLAHVHFASCEDSANRLRALGEEEFRIYNTGAPQLDDLNRDFTRNVTQLNEHSQVSAPYIMLVMHPLMVDRHHAQEELAASIEACLAFELPIVCIYPNSDLGYAETIKTIKRYQQDGRVTFVENLERDVYLELLFNAAVLVGNSSSGILEAPSFRVPVINIGERQRGRPQASNILNCGTSKEEIERSISVALYDQKFLKKCQAAVNPYGDGNSSPRICEIIRDVDLGRRLLDKNSTI